MNELEEDKIIQSKKTIKEKMIEQMGLEGYEREKAEIELALKEIRIKRRKKRFMYENW